MSPHDDPPHRDTLEAAVPHFNASFRYRYRLPSTTLEYLREVPGLKDEFDNLATIRANGVVDASCAVIARVVLSNVPRYAIGILDGSGRVAVLSPDDGNDDAYRSHHVLLVNPLGGPDNWGSIARWVRHQGGDKARRAELAGLASEQRPDQVANLELLRRAASENRRAIAIPPDEGFSTTRAAEVSCIYQVPVETLRAWKRRYRAPLSGGQLGAPRRNR